MSSSSFPFRARLKSSNLLSLLRKKEGDTKSDRVACKIPGNAFSRGYREKKRKKEIKRDVSSLIHSRGNKKIKTRGRETHSPLPSWRTRINAKKIILRLPNETPPSNIPFIPPRSPSFLLPSFFLRYTAELLNHRIHENTVAEPKRVAQVDIRRIHRAVPSPPFPEPPPLSRPFSLLFSRTTTTTKIGGNPESAHSCSRMRSE